MSWQEGLPQGCVHKRARVVAKVFVYFHATIIEYVQYTQRVLVACWAQLDRQTPEVTWCAV